MSHLARKEHPLELLGLHRAGRAARSGRENREGKVEDRGLPINSEKRAALV